MPSKRVLGEFHDLLKRVEDYLYDLQAEDVTATNSLLRLTLSQDVCLSRDAFYHWACTIRLLQEQPHPAFRNAPDALRCAIAWHLMQPHFKQAKVIVRKARATKRGAYLQLHTTEGPHEYVELLYLSTNADGSETKYLPGKAAAHWPILAGQLLPADLIAFGQQHLFSRDLWKLCGQLLGESYWAGVYRLPLAQAQTFVERIEALNALLISGSITCDMVTILEEKEAMHDYTC